MQNNPDLQTRVEAFNKKLAPLLGEYKLALGSEAFLSKDGRIASRPALFDNPEPPNGIPVNQPAKQGQGQEEPKSPPQEQVGEKSPITEG
jgi:hypothetical protein